MSNINVDLNNITKDLSILSYKSLVRLYQKYDKIFPGCWPENIRPISKEYWERQTKLSTRRLEKKLIKSNIISKQDFISLISKYIPSKHQEKIFTHLNGKEFYWFKSNPRDLIVSFFERKFAISRARWAYTLGYFDKTKVIDFHLIDYTISHMWLVELES